jgi:hypothetical protein
VFGTRIGRKSIDDGYAAGKQYRERREGKPSGEADSSEYKPSIWIRIAIAVSVLGIGLFVLSLMR